MSRIIAYATGGMSIGDCMKTDVLQFLQYVRCFVYAFFFFPSHWDSRIARKMTAKPVSIRRVIFS